jgi:hypothetical protein
MAASAPETTARSRLSDALWMLPAVAMLLALSLAPAMFGPLLAPKVLPVMASLMCPDDTVAARTEIYSVWRRKGLSSEWRVRCEDASGRHTQASPTRALLCAWSLFNGALVLTASLASRLNARLNRYIRGGRG